MAQPVSILLVEDEASIAEPLGYLLEAEGFSVTTTGDGTEAIELFFEINPDLVLLDLMLPGTPGLEVCKSIRASIDPLAAQTPIIILTAKNSEIDKVVGLELGADDYITKPYSARELLARIKSVMRRVRTSESIKGKPAESGYLLDETEVLKIRHVELDLVRHSLTVNGEEINLPLKEFELLEVLLRNQGRVLTRGQLINLVWGSDYFGDTKTLDVHIKRLRSRIETGDESGRIIHTVRGVGYRID